MVGGHGCASILLQGLVEDFDLAHGTEEPCYLGREDACPGEGRHLYSSCSWYFRSTGWASTYVAVVQGDGGVVVESGRKAKEQHGMNVGRCYVYGYGYY